MEIQFHYTDLVDNDRSVVANECGMEVEDDIDEEDDIDDGVDDEEGDVAVGDRLCYGEVVWHDDDRVEGES